MEDEQVYGGCIEIMLSEKSADQVKAVFKRYGMECDQDLHCTLMYDKDNPEIGLPFDRHISVLASHTDYKVMGTKLALILQSNDLLEHYHKQLKNAGFSHSYRVFTPHMSICDSFDVTEEVADVLCSALPKKLIFEGIVRFKAKP